MSVRKIHSVIKPLGQKAVSALRVFAHARKTIIFEMVCAGIREVNMFYISIKVMIIKG
jgi:hypothetical protein